MLDNLCILADFDCDNEHANLSITIIVEQDEQTGHALRQTRIRHFP